MRLSMVLLPRTEAGTGSGLEASQNSTSNQETGRSWALLSARSTRSLSVVAIQTNP
ncbi:hypothetical protein [Nocardiopsis sp. CNR-923]|uniref:hypothetical protein n=1 Tax=Nocardiopsis sp. CNR-923 TaxID=1904965 RepID=UPI0021CCCE6E|nr:hypothetical protein [Nocardiopsis sp. CNR-923]